MERSWEITSLPLPHITLLKWFQLNIFRTKPIQSLISRDWGSNPRSTAPEANMLIIIPPMQFSCIWRIGFVLKIFNWNHFSKVICGRGREVISPERSMVYYTTIAPHIPWICFLFFKNVSRNIDLFLLPYVMYSKLPPLKMVCLHYK
jgi:hypothetical protein